MLLRRHVKTLGPVTFLTYSELTSSSSSSSVRSRQNRCNEKRHSSAGEGDGFLRPLLREATQNFFPSSRLACTWLSLTRTRPHRHAATVRSQLHWHSATLALSHSATQSHWLSARMAQQQPHAHSATRTLAFKRYWQPAQLALSTTRIQAHSHSGTLALTHTRTQPHSQYRISFPVTIAALIMVDAVFLSVSFLPTVNFDTSTSVMSV